MFGLFSGVSHGVPGEVDDGGEKGSVTMCGGSAGQRLRLDVQAGD